MFSKDSSFRENTQSFFLFKPNHSIFVSNKDQKIIKKLFFMNNSIYNFPVPSNEPILGYLKGSPERIALDAELKRQSNTVVEIPLIIDGKEVFTGNTSKIVMPHNHSHTLAIYHKAGEKEIRQAIDAAMKAHSIWNELNWTVRASIMLKIAELLSVKYRATVNASNNAWSKQEHISGRN